MPDLRAVETVLTALSESELAGEVAAGSGKLAREALELLGAGKPVSMLRADEGVELALASKTEPAIGLQRDVFSTDRTVVPSYHNLVAQMQVNHLNVEDLLAARTSENLLGAGNEHSVWSIPKLRQYALRDLSTGNTAFSGHAVLQPVTDLLPDTNIGQAVAKIGDVQIVKRALGTPHGPALFGAAAELISDVEKDEKYAEAIRTAARMPQSAFDGLAHDLKAAERVGLQFDAINSNNILVDSEAKRFNLLDFSPSYKASNTLTHMLDALANPARFKDLDRMRSLKSEYLVLMKKSMAAAEQEGLSQAGDFFDFLTRMIPPSLP